VAQDKEILEIREQDPLRSTKKRIEKLFLILLHYTVKLFTGKNQNVKNMKLLHLLSQAEFL
jgi:hypothetical protein